MIQTDRVLRYARELPKLELLLGITDKYQNKTLHKFYLRRIDEILELLEQHLGE